jgi:type II/III secretion system protein
MRSTRLLFPVIALLLLAVPPAESLLAQSAAPKATEPPKEDFITEKGFASRIFEVKHRDAADLAAVVRPLGSGFRGASVSASREFRTITVRDFPENIATIEAALKRMDVAETARRDVELRLWVLVAGEGAGGQFPEELKEAVAALKATLAYRNYTLAGTFVQRVRDGARGLHGEGVTDIGATSVNEKAGRPMQLEYQINQLTLDGSGAGPASIKLDGFSLTLVGEGRAQLKTDATLREGEKVVVGTSTVRDRALVVVVSARVIR